MLFSALSGVIAAAVAVPLFAFSSGGSRATQLDGTLGGNAVGAVSASTGHIFAAIPLSASPDAIAAGAGSIWVAMSDRGAVSRIDPATNTVQQTIPTPGEPSALTVGGGFVWVANTLAGTVARIDPRTNGGQVVGKPIRVGNGPSGIAYGLGAVWVANSVDRTVIRIDPVTGTPGRPISVEDGADGVAAGDGSVWVIGRSAGGSLAHRSGRAHGRRHDERRERARRRRRRPRRRVGGERGGRDGVEDRSLEWAPGRCVPGRQAAERHRRRSGRPRLGCERRLGDPDRARPRDGPRDPDRPDRRTAQRGRAGRRDGVRRGPGAAERAPRRHAHARRREPARRVRAADPEGARSRLRLLGVGAPHVDERRAPRLQPSGRRRDLQGRPRPGHRPPDGQRRRPHVHLPAAQGDPLLDRRGRPARGYPPRDRTGAAPERRPVSENDPLPGRDRGQPRLPDGQAQALRSHARHHDQSGIEHGDLPPQQARSRLPVQARTARVRRRSCLDAAARAAAAARDRPVQDRRLPVEGRRRARPQPALPRLVGRGAAGRLPRQDRRTVPVHGSVRNPCGRARHRRHHGGRPRSDLAACARGLPADAPLEPALPRAAAHDPRALAEHEARAVQRRPRPAGVQPRGRPQPARPDQRPARWRASTCRRT